jgi:hypothetical protein
MLGPIQKYQCRGSSTFAMLLTTSSLPVSPTSSSLDRTSPGFPSPRDVATTSGHDDNTGVELDEVEDLASGNVNLDGVVDLDGRFQHRPRSRCS